MAALSTIATVQAAAVGRSYNFKQPTNGDSLTGWTCRLDITHPVTKLTASHNLTVADDGSFCTLSTSGLEFPIAGKYTVQIWYSQGGGAEAIPSAQAYIIALTNSIPFA